MGMFLIQRDLGTCTWIQDIGEIQEKKKKIIIGQKFIFLQDNDPKQKAKFTMEWLAKNMVVIWSGQVKALTEIPQNI